MPNRRETAVISLIGWTVSACLTGVMVGAVYMRGAHPAVVALFAAYCLFASVNVVSEAIYLSDSLRDDQEGEETLND